MKLVVVIVNYRTPGLVVDCLRSLEPEIRALPGARVVVVDNDSRDGSQEQLASAIAREGWSEWARLLQAGRNGGFGFGNNLGLRSALVSADDPEYVCFLNPDTRVLPRALHELLDFMQQHPEVGIVGSQIEGEAGDVQCSAFRFHNLAAEFESTLCLGFVSRLLGKRIVAPPPRAQAHATDWVGGASLLIRRRVLEEIGGFDERYFLYFEESDLCLQAARAGWPSWYVPASRIVHLGGRSTGLNDPSRPMPDYWFESRRHYFSKNHGRLYLVAANIAWLSGFALWRVRQLLHEKPGQHKPRMFSNFLRLSFATERSRA